MAERVVIRVEDLKKRYRLGVIGGSSLGEELQALIARWRGRPDPRWKVDQAGQEAGGSFWALQGVSFVVREGEILGIIGKNGAGKSTLLKLLSRITTPTEGRIRMKGRVSSLLEVGTGFNPELTGRENIHLNGAILGMRQAEIDAKLDRIIAFSGIQHHIDTPVKRYSSGMKVRLGFAVAAHLEPEILIVDEVLAVGDAEFQRKSLGKIRDVSRSGRTVLMVSHNMTAIASMCSRTIWLEEGRVKMDGPTDEVVRAYLGAYNSLGRERSWAPGVDAPGNELLQLTHVAVEGPAEGGPITTADAFRLRIGFHNLGITDGDLNVGIHVYNGEDILAFASTWREGAAIPPALVMGDNEVRCHVPGELLNTGDYRIVVNFFRHARLMVQVDETVAFEVHDQKRDGAWFGRRKGVFRPKLVWES